MNGSLSLESSATDYIIRCQCGIIVVAQSLSALVDLVRLHFGEFHPDLGANVPADLIVAMAEEQERR